MTPLPAPGSALPAATRRVLASLRAAVEAFAPGATRSGAVAGKPWGTMTVAGVGTRRLPGMRIDRRAHEIRATTDGAWLQLTYRVDGALVDSATRTDAATGGPAATAAFVRRHLPRVWWKAPPPPAEGAAASRPRGRRKAGPKTPRGQGGAPRGAGRHRKP